MPTNASHSTENIVRQISQQLAFDFGDRFTDELIEKHVSESLEALGPARVRTYLPLLVHRAGWITAAIQIGTFDRASGKPPEEIPTHKKPASQPETTVNGRNQSEPHFAGQRRHWPETVGQE